MHMPALNPRVSIRSSSSSKLLLRKQALMRLPHKALLSQGMRESRGSLASKRLL